MDYESYRKGNNTVEVLWMGQMMAIGCHLQDGTSSRSGFTISRGAQPPSLQRPLEDRARRFGWQCPQILNEQKRVALLQDSFK